MCKNGHFLRTGYHLSRPSCTCTLVECIHDEVVYTVQVLLTPLIQLQWCRTLKRRVLYAVCFLDLHSVLLVSLPSTWRKHVCIDLLSYFVRSFGELSSSRFVIGLFLLLPPCAEAKGPNSGCVSVTGYSVHGTPICDFHI